MRRALSATVAFVCFAFVVVGALPGAAAAEEAPGGATPTTEVAPVAQEAAATETPGPVLQAAPETGTTETTPIPTEPAPTETLPSETPPTEIPPTETPPTETPPTETLPSETPPAGTTPPETTPPSSTPAESSSATATTGPTGSSSTTSAGGGSSGSARAAESAAADPAAVEPSVTLRQTSSESPVGTPLGLSATVEDADECGYWLITVEGANDSGDGPRSLAPRPDAGAHRVTASYVGESTGGDTITATWQPCTGLVMAMFGGVEAAADDEFHAWAATVEIEPDSGVTLVGEYLDLEVFVDTGDSTYAPAGYVEVEVTGANPGTYQSYTPFYDTGTDRWSYPVSYQGTTVGHDDITATFYEYVGDGFSEEGSGTAEHDWRPPVVTIEPASGQTVVGGYLDLEVVVEAADPEDGPTGYVVVEVTGANPDTYQSESPAYDGDDDRWVYLVSYQGTEAGHDDITATYYEQYGEEDPQAQASATAERDWRAPQVTIEPASGTTLVGEYLFLDVFVEAADPEEGPDGHVTVDVTGANPGSYSSSSPTFDEDAGWSYQVSYRGTEVGHDEITATYYEQYGDGDPQAQGSGTAEHDWRPPDIVVTVLTPEGPSGTPPPLDLGEFATVQVELPDGDRGGELTVRIVGGPHDGDEIPMVQISGDGEGEPYVYRGGWPWVPEDGSAHWAPGDDLVQAFLTVDEDDGDGDGEYPTIDDTYASDPLTQSWNTPAVLITRSSESSFVRETMTFTAEITGTTEGVVAFALDGPNAGTPVIVDEVDFPFFTGRYVGTQPGTDLIIPTVTAFGGDYESVASAVEHEWVLPVVVASQDTLTTLPGETVQLAATVVPEVPGTVTFSVAGPGGRLTFSDDGSDGSFTAAYTRDVDGIGTDTITATLTAASGPTYVSDPISHQWDPRPEPRVVLSPAGVASCPGDIFSPTATVTDRGAPVPGSPVRIEVTRGATSQTLTGTTGQDGQTTVSYSRTVVGLDSVVATAVVNGATVTSAPLPHVWQACALTVTITPAGTTSTVNSTFSPTVLVRNADGRPVAGAAVQLQVTMPGSATLTRSLTTGTAGTATTSYSRSVAGTDRLEARVTSGPRSGQGTTTHGWEEADGLTLSVEPPGVATQAGTEFTVTALLLDGGRPLPDTAVAFVSTMHGEKELQGTATTDAAGRATYTYGRKVAGSDEVTATVTLADGRTARAALAHIWTAPPPPVIEESDHGTLVVRGIPVPGGRVSVVGSGCPAGSTVKLSINGAQVATTRADGDGRFEAPVQLTGLTVGRYTASAVCEPVRVNGALDVIQPTAAGSGVAARVSTAAAVMCFLVLLGSQVLRISSGDPVGAS